MLNVNGFLQTLPIMLWGMIGIFIVIGIIYFVIAMMNKFFANSK